MSFYTLDFSIFTVGIDYTIIHLGRSLIVVESLPYSFLNLGLSLLIVQSLMFSDDV
ncbi:hypothetical protein J0W42_13205 [Clostridioides difficile]|nr:hypothetical protein [Clostridioides difficile]MCJ0373759.1 hypothetical protein [Clostridioides difficile]